MNGLSAVDVAKAGDADRSRQATLSWHEQIVASHLFWLRQPQQKQKSWCHIGQNPVFAPEPCSIIGHVNEMHKIACVRSIRRTITVAHLLAIAVVGGHDGFAVKLEKIGNNPRHAFIHCLYSFDSCFDRASMADHYDIGE